MNQPILFPCSPSLGNYRWLIFLVILCSLFLMLVLINQSFAVFERLFSNVDSVMFVVIHVPSVFGVFYAFVQTRLWFFQLIQKINDVNVSIRLLQFLDINENEFMMTKKQPVHKKLAKMSIIAYLCSLSFCLGILFYAGHYSLVSLNIIHLLWNHFLRLQIAFLIWVSMRFIVSPLVIRCLF